MNVCFLWITHCNNVSKVTLDTIDNNLLCEHVSKIQPKGLIVFTQVLKINGKCYLACGFNLNRDFFSFQLLFIITSIDWIIK